MQEAHHGGFRIEHALVHVDIDDLGAAGHLLARDIERGRVVAGLDELAELRGTGDVGPLADVHEERLIVYVERLQPGQPALDGNTGNHPAFLLSQRLMHEPDVFGSRAAAATYY